MPGKAESYVGACRCVESHSIGASENLAIRHGYRYGALASTLPHKTGLRYAEFAGGIIERKHIGGVGYRMLD
jgi:hypothetical protein